MCIFLYFCVLFLTILSSCQFSRCHTTHTPLQHPPMTLRVAIFGHSYVRDLQSSNFRPPPCYTFKYFALPGATFTSVLNSPAQLNPLQRFQPHFCVVILGGNDIKAHTPISETYRLCKEFYTLLRTLLPQTRILASQIENRFYARHNKYNSPPAKTFNFLRKHFNRHLRNKDYKDNIVQLQGTNRLDSRRYYRDLVHLTRQGLRILFRYILNTISYASNSSHTHKHGTRSSRSSVLSGPSRPEAPAFSLPRRRGPGRSRASLSALVPCG